VKGTDRTLEEVVAEEEEGQGTNWTVNIFQRGLMIELTIYI
jgi:hypothetical protein